uniref:NTF2 domain-containing protein n=1 Tax=Palpitomonas bilix TaxID=652834 RepID=A0A7S3G6Q1_9EUKA|mmetsp:Transcript_23902/g.60448  ORF Transcript_23902/g.60448 Transcript_23902/m.60448 type:complete len:104 (+) Transcript_23902:79-390(+)
MFLLFQESSMMTYENEKFRGTDSIMTKLITEENKGLEKFTIAHEISSADFQPTPAGGIICFVTGSIKIDDAPPMQFSEVFHLAPGGPLNLWIQNIIFRFNFAM